jgi:hypothetical protein
MKSDMEVDNMKFKKAIIISIVISVILLICSLLLPNINIDKDTIGYNSNDTYNIKAYNVIRDINKYIKISDNIDKKVLGNYQVTVKVRYLFYRYNKVFDIKVVDKVKPFITLLYILLLLLPSPPASLESTFQSKYTYPLLVTALTSLDIIPLL